MRTLSKLALMGLLSLSNCTSYQSLTVKEDKVYVAGTTYMWVIFPVWWGWVMECQQHDKKLVCVDLQVWTPGKGAPPPPPKENPT